MSRIPERAFVSLLDRQGEQFDSLSFSRFLEAAPPGGPRRLLRHRRAARPRPRGRRAPLLARPADAAPPARARRAARAALPRPQDPRRRALSLLRCAAPPPDASPCWSRSRPCASGRARRSPPRRPRSRRRTTRCFAISGTSRAIQIPAAWAISRGEGATVAVLDTGVAFEDRGRYRQAPDFAGTRFVAGYDFVDDDPYPDDVPPPDGRRSHGTLMAGLIAQTAGNALGGAGVAPAGDDHAGARAGPGPRRLGARDRPRRCASPSTTAPTW